MRIYINIKYLFFYIFIYFFYWLNESSGLNNFELNSFTKYSELSEFKTIIDAAQENLGKAADTSEAETVVATAKTNLVAKAKEYTGSKLEEIFKDAGLDGYILTDEAYKDARQSIANSNDVANILETYENAIKNRMTTDKFNLEAAQKAACAELDEYESDVELEEDVTLDEASVAQKEKLVNDAKTEINNVTEKQYKGNNEIINEKVTATEQSIDALYTLANTKKTGYSELETSYNNGIKGFEAAEDLKGEELEAAKTELTRLYNEAKEAIANAVDTVPYNTAKADGLAKMRAYYTLATTKATARKALTDDATSKKASNEKYTEADKARIDAALAEALKLLDAETVVDAETVENAQTAGLELIKNAFLFNGSAISSREKISTYVACLDRTVPNSETVKYNSVESIKNVIDDELARIDTRTTPEELVADRNVARKNIYEAVRAYMVQALDELAELTVTKSTDKLLSMDCYKVLKTNKEALTTNLTEEVDTLTQKKYSDDEALSTLLTKFNDMAVLEDVSAVRADMIAELNNNESIKPLLGNVLGGNTTYADISVIKTLIEAAKTSINKANSYADYNKAVDRVVERLPEGVTNALSTLIDTALKGKPADVIRRAKMNVEEAKTISDKVQAYEKIMIEKANEVYTSNEKIKELLSGDSDNEEGKLFGSSGRKKIDDLQENVTIKDGVVSGTLKYVNDFTEFGKSESTGNYLVMVFMNDYAVSGHIDVTDGDPKDGRDFNPKDGVLYILRLEDGEEKTREITVTYKSENGTKFKEVYKLSGLTLSPNN